MRLALVGIGLIGGDVAGSTPVSSELAAKRLLFEQKKREVSQYGSSVRRMEESIRQLSRRRESLTRDYHALDDRQQEVRDQMSGDLVRARLQQAKAVYEALDGIANLQTFNLKKIAMDKLSGAVTDQFTGPMLEAQGVKGPMVQLSSEANAQLPEMARLRTLLAADIETLKTMTTNETWLVSENTGLLLRQGEMVDSQLSAAKSALYRIAQNIDQALTAANQAVGQMTPQWQAAHDFVWQLQSEIETLEAVEPAKILEVIQGPILALDPPPAAPPALPDPPVPEPEQTPLEIYTEYYQAGIDELDYYLPGWIAGAQAKHNSILTLQAQFNETLGLNGLSDTYAGSCPTLDYVENILQPSDPDAARMEPTMSATTPAEPAKLSTLAQRHRQFVDAAAFFTTSRVPNAVNAAEQVLAQYKGEVVAYRDLQRKIASLTTYAEEMDQYYTTLGLGDVPPPALSVVAALQNWPGIEAADATHSLADAAMMQAELDYDLERAAVTVTRLHACIPVLATAFAERYVPIKVDLAELVSAIAAYRAAFARCEQAIAAYNALAQGSVIGRDRAGIETVANYTNLEMSSSQEHTHKLDLWLLSNLVYSSPAAEIRAIVASARADLISAETHAENYRRARHDLLAAWEVVNELFPHFKDAGSPSRYEWTEAWTRQTEDSLLRVTEPDFAAVDAFGWVYNDGNNLTLAVFNGLTDLPVPEVEALDDLLDVVDTTEQMIATGTGWSSLSAAQLASNLSQWLQGRRNWLGGRAATWKEIFGDWATAQAAFVRDNALGSHAFTNGDPAAPVITRQPVSVKVGRGQRATLSLEVFGTLFSCDWAIYTPYGGGGFYTTQCRDSFDLTFRTPPITVDTMFICKLRWGATPDADAQVLYSDVVTVSVEDGVNQSVDPVSLTVPAAGGTYPVTLNSIGVDGALAWTGYSSAFWVTPTPAGAGSGTVQLTVEPNLLDANRDARVTLGNAVVTVRQTYGGQTGEPIFTQHPADQYADVGSTVVFSAAATGTPVPTYQWYRGLTLLAGQTGSILSLGNVQPADAGVYTVRATNTVATVTSSTATLVVRGTQTLTFAALADRTIGDPPFMLSASSSSGLAPSYSVVAGPASLSGNTLTLTGPGIVTVRASQPGDSAFAPAATVEHSFLVSDSLTHWTEQAFTYAELGQPAVSGPLATTTSDGLPNLLKYALGLAPRQPVVAGLPELTCDGTQWILTYSRPTTTGDVTYRVLASTDLITWTPDGVIHEWVSTAGNTETWRGRCPVGSWSRVFLRLQVEVP